MPTKTSSSLPPSKEQIALAGKYQKKLDQWLARNHWCPSSKLWISAGVSATTIARIKKGYISNKTAQILESFLRRNEDEPSIVVVDEPSPADTIKDIIERHRQQIAKELNVDVKNIQFTLTA